MLTIENFPHPFASPERFLFHRRTSNTTEVRPGFILETVRGFHRPGLHHYRRLICHQKPPRSVLDPSLSFPYLLGTVQGIPCHLELSVNDAIRNHTTIPTRYQALRYLACLPSRLG